MNSFSPLLISVIIPVFHAECFLSDAIESVLAQAAVPLDQIVADYVQLVEAALDRQRAAQ